MIVPVIIKIVGMPRSGTAFAATILGLHPIVCPIMSLLPTTKTGSGLL